MTHTSVLFEQFDRIDADTGVGPVGGSIRSADITSEAVVFDATEHGFGAIVRIVGTDAIIRTADPDDGLGRERVPVERLERVPKHRMPTYINTGMDPRTAHR